MINWIWFYDENIPLWADLTLLFPADYDENNRSEPTTSDRTQPIIDRSNNYELF